MEKDNEPSAITRLRDLQHKLAELSENSNGEPSKEELYLFIAAILEYDDGLCMDNEAERNALSSVLATELQHFFTLEFKDGN
jgi:hypothetical protein